MAFPQKQTRTWWKEGVCYQVWPLSFKDSNGDGDGDIPGLIGKLDYLKDLGVDYIWLSPMYASPRNDYGYDISDYQSVHPRFGTLQDMDDLIGGLRSRGMRLILDLVVNHTSVEHKWFQKSAQSKNNEYSHYYIWRDPKIIDGKRSPPNNWKALMGGSAWKYVESRDQYYLRLFLESMPDLNWEAHDVRRAIYEEAIDFWLKRGVAGFRCDACNLYSKNTSFPDAPIEDVDEEYQNLPMEWIFNGPRMHEWMQEQRREALSKYGEDVVLVGELGPGSTDDLKQYLSPETRELDMNFDFDIFWASGPQWGHPWADWIDRRSMTELRKALTKTQGYTSELGLWSTTFFENHDQPRSISNFGSRNAQFCWQSGKLLALLVASLSGTLFIYQGQEIGMSNIPETWDRSEFRDPFWIGFLEEAERKYPKDPAMQKKALEIFQRCSRDHARTPVQWSAEEPYAGFSTTKPWIRINENFKQGVNVQDQINTPDSLLAFWRQVVAFRKAHPETLIYGHSKFIDIENENILSIIKHEANSDGKGKKLLIVLNYSDDTRPFPSFAESELGGQIGPMLFGTKPGSVNTDLHAWEGRVFEL